MISWLLLAPLAAQPAGCDEIARWGRDLESEWPVRWVRAAEALRAHQDLWSCWEQLPEPGSLALRRLIEEVVPATDSSVVRKLVIEGLGRVPVDARALEIALAWDEPLPYELCWKLMRSPALPPDRTYEVAKLVCASDPARAAADWLALARSESGEDVVLALHGCARLGVLPGDAEVRRLLSDPRPEVARAISSLIGSAPRERVPFLLALFEDEALQGDPGVKWIPTRLRFLSRMTEEQAAGIGSWRSWWQEHGGLDDADLERRSAVWVAERLRSEPGPERIPQCSLEVLDEPEVTAALARLLTAPSSPLAGAAARLLLDLACRGTDVPGCADAVAAYLALMPPEVTFLSFGRDLHPGRTSPAMFALAATMIATKRADGLPWHRFVSQSLASSRRAEALPILRSACYEQGDLSAASWLPLVPGADSLATEALERFLRSEDAEMRRRALAVLAATARDDVVTPVLEFLEAAEAAGKPLDLEHRRQIHGLLALFPAEVERATLLAHLRDPDRTVVQSAAEALTRVGDWRGIHHLLDHLTSGMERGMVPGGFTGDSVATFLRMEEVPDKPGILRAWFAQAPPEKRIKIIALIQEDPHPEPLYWELLLTLAPELLQADRQALADAAFRLFAVDESSGVRVGTDFSSPERIEVTWQPATAAGTPAPVAAIKAWLEGGPPLRGDDFPSRRLELEVDLQVTWQRRDAVLLVHAWAGITILHYVLLEVGGRWQPVAAILPPDLLRW